MVGSPPAIDGLRPERVEQPDDAEQLAEALRVAAGRGEAVVPVGGGRALGLGAPLERFDVALETRRLNRVLERSQADMTVSVEAGITLEEVNQELGEVGQILPIDPFNSPGHTVGGILATGLSGPLRLRFGSPRDFVIGLRVALPDGRLVSSGGRVVKNVSGYDLNKLHQGALGALGVIVAASFKVFPRPLVEVTLETRAPAPWNEAERALSLSQQPAALELSSDGRLLARFWGTRDGVERVRGELGWKEASPELWKQHAARGGDAWARVSVPPAHLRQVVHSLPSNATWWASPGVGVAHWVGDLEPPDIAAVRGWAEAAGGSLVLMSAPAQLKRSVGAWGRMPVTLDRMRRLRDAFDPKRTISPGRFVV